MAQIHRITTHEHGGYVMQKVPGLEGDLIQDLGRTSLAILVEGIFYGPEITKELQTLRSLHLKREPVEFLAEVTGRAYASKVVIDSLKVLESGEQPDQYTYEMMVIEHVEPPASGVSALSKTMEFISAEAMEIAELMEVPDLLALGTIPELSNPVVPLKGVLTPVKEASSVLLEASKGLSSLFK